MPPDLSAIPVSDIEEGTLVRVLLSSAANSKLFSGRPRHHGLFRVKPGGEKDVLQERDWRRLVGFNRRKFIAQVVTNDVDNQQLILQIENSRTTKSTQVRYQVVLPYNQILRLARLVFQAREFASNEEEEEFRRQFRQNPVNKAYFDPKDRFAGVSLIATLGGPVLINFTHQVAVTGPSFIVPLPAGVFDDGDYTVTSGYNTPVGAPPPLAVPDSTKTETGFTVNTVSGGNVDAGTTIDFHVQAR